MTWRDYTVDSVPEIFGAIEELDDFILNADVTDEDFRSILYMLSAAAIKESVLEAIYNTREAILQDMREDPLTSKARLERISLELPYEEMCKKATNDWREEIEAAQVQRELSHGLGSRYLN